MKGRVGAKVKVLGRPGSGTEVELCVPREIAFETDPSSLASHWFYGQYIGGAKSINQDLMRALK